MTPLVRWVWRVVAFSFVATMVVTIVWGLPEQDIADGSVIFIVAIAAALVAVYIFVRRNGPNIEATVLGGDRTAFWRVVIGRRGGKH